MPALPAPPLLVITDRRRVAGSLEDVVAAALHGGCRWFSLREKDLPGAEQVRLLTRLLALAHPRGARITVHGDPVLAVEAGADGVHLPSGASPAEARRRLGAGVLIGASAHGVAEAEAAGSAGADYVTLSPVFPSASKPGYGPPLGLAGLADATARLAVPVIALGGVTAANAAGCLATGAAGVAVMGTIMAAPDPEAATARLVAALDRAS